MKTMSKLAAFTLGSALMAAAGTAQAERYDLDPTHSFVQFKVSHLGYSWLVGRFNQMSGTLEYDAKTPSNNAIEMTVETTSLDTNHKVRDGHLSAADVLDNKGHPKATFVSSKYEGDAEEGEITGVLTINGVEKEVTVPVTKIGEGKDPWGGYRVGYEGELTFDRRDFGSDKNFGPASWDVTLEVFIEAIKQK